MNHAPIHSIPADQPCPYNHVSNIENYSGPGWYSLNLNDDPTRVYITHQPGVRLLSIYLEFGDAGQPCAKPFLEMSPEFFDLNWIERLPDPKHKPQ